MVDRLIKHVQYCKWHYVKLYNYEVAAKLRDIEKTLLKIKKNETQKLF